MTKTEFDLQIVIVAGPSDITRATLGFAFALGAAASGQSVVVFLTMDGASWADPSIAQPRPPRGFETVRDYIAELFELDATIEGCTSCIEQHCALTHEGIVLAGLSTAAARAADVPTVTF